MEKSPSEADPPIDPPWQTVDAILDAVATMARQDLEESEFFALMWRRLSERLPLLGAAVWQRGDDGRARLRHQFQPEVSPALTGWSESGESARRAIVDRVLTSGAAETCSIESGRAAYLGVIGRWMATESLDGALELGLAAGTGGTDRCRYVRLVDALGEIIADYHRGRLLRVLDERQQHLARYDQFLLAIHRSVELDATAYAIANEGRQFIGCDRLSVLVRLGSSLQVVAISGVDRVAPRSNVVRHLERLAESIGRTGERIWDVNDRAGLPPQVEQCLAQHLDETHARDLVALPGFAAAVTTTTGTAADRRAACVLIAEQFHGVLDAAARRRFQLILDHSAAALANAATVREMPLRRLSRGIQAAERAAGLGGLSKVMLGVVGISVLIAVLSLVPATLTVEARGELQPARRHDVFAPDDAVVSELAVAHGSPVEAGQPLVILRRAELERESMRVGGELETARKRLTAVAADRLSAGSGEGGQRNAYVRLTAEEEELTVMIAALERQQAVLQQQQAAMVVRSPVAGKVLTWQVEQLLKGRPVARGQTLLTVADTAGPWELTLRIPDRQVAHVLRARRQAAGPLDVTFILATAPDRPIRGRLTEVASRTQIDAQGEAFVLATADVESSGIAQAVAGSSVLARIDCGRRALGYVWFHGAIDTLKRRVLF